MRFRSYLVILAIANLSAVPAFAQSLTGNKEPVQIDASQSLEWLRDRKQYVAREDVHVVQGDMTIHCDLLVADYRENKKSGSDVYRLTATGHVVMTSGESKATGEKAVYDIDNGLVTLTGGDLRLSSPGQTVTAQERFEYRVADKRLTAFGDTKAVRGEDTITAGTMSAFFAQDAKTGKTALDRLEAQGDVTITTPDEVVKGKSGRFDAGANMAYLNGDVSITRGPNRLEGQSADVDMTTNVSRMHGGDTASNKAGRVKGVFYPGSEKPQTGAGTP